MTNVATMIPNLDEAITGNDTQKQSNSRSPRRQLSRAPSGSAFRLSPPAPQREHLCRRTTPPKRGVIFLHQSGAPSQMDLFDCCRMKAPPSVPNPRPVRKGSASPG